MKTRNIYSMIGAALLAVGFVACASEKELEAKAKVSRADAEKIALAKVPGGTIKDSEIEAEKGRLIWSFDITAPGANGVTEVEVDANTGAVLSGENEDAQNEDNEGSEKDDKDDDKD